MTLQNSITITFALQVNEQHEQHVLFKVIQETLVQFYQSQKELSFLK